MVWSILFLYVFLVEALVSINFLNSLAERRKPLSVVIIAGILIFEIGALINIFVVSTATVNITFTVIATSAVSLLFFKIKPARSVFYSSLLVAISTFIENTTILTMSSISNVHIVDYKSEMTLLVIEGIVSKSLFFLVAMLTSHFLAKDSPVSKIPITLYLFPIITLAVSIGFWYLSLNQHLVFANQIILGVVSMLFFISTLIVFFSFQTNAQKENQLLLLQQEQDKIKTDITYYDILEQQNNNLRAYAHDAKRHLSAIKNLNTNPEIDIYISEMLERLAEYSKVCHSGNHVLDVVIDKYVTECKINSIAFNFDIKNNNLSQVEAYDIVTVLGNLLDNAVEAALKSDEKQVAVETDFRNNFSVIIVSNSCDINPLSGNTDLPATTKSNKRLHGFGLKSVRKTAKKYNGDIAFDYDIGKKKFTATVMIEG